MNPRGWSSARRPLVALVIPALCSLAALVAAPGSTSVAAQTPSGSDDWEVPRTTFGHPDLQGNWTNATRTPLERPEGQGPVLTPEEVQQIEGRLAEFVAEDLAPSDPNRPAPPEGGRDFDFCSSPTGCYNEVFTSRGDRVAVVDEEPRSSLVTRPSDGRVPELTPEGRKRVEEYRDRRRGFGPYDHPELRPLGERCITAFGSSAGPPMLPNYWYNNNYTIVQNPAHVLIMTEMVHDIRIVRLDDPDPLPDGIRPWFGDSRGHWEGSTLVIETTNVHPDQLFRGVPPSEDLRVVERLTRVDEETILYEFTVHDPTTYTEPWGGEIPFKKFDQPLYEYACHEGNYSLQNVLSGARYQERQERGEEARR